ncbi:MAG: twin-arginine translocation signal domain-containing protein [Pseudomonadales bacterium]|nr:twin-arginine translocation signal domain-containing protein [Pseudomonadales bacterium]
MNSRRDFLKKLTLASVSVATFSVAACSQPQKRPTPFQTGEEVTPPLGCSELRANDANGDCE